VREGAGRHVWVARRIVRFSAAGFVGKTTWTARLGAGVFRFGSDPRRLSGTLRVR
jgi:hypothetical protein